MTNTDRTARPEARAIDLTVGERTHQLMWQNKISNKSLAATLGIDQTAIGKKLRAEQKFSIAQLSAVARLLDTTIAYLVGETDDPTMPNGEDGGPRGARTHDPRINGALVSPIFIEANLHPVADLDTERARRHPAKASA